MAGLASEDRLPPLQRADRRARLSCGRLALAAGNPLTRTAYSFVSDSGGGHANPGAEVDLLFATDNEAYLYFSDLQRRWARTGATRTRRTAVAPHFDPRLQSERDISP